MYTTNQVSPCIGAVPSYDGGWLPRLFQTGTTFDSHTRTDSHYSANESDVDSYHAYDTTGVSSIGSD